MPRKIGGSPELPEIPEPAEVWRLVWERGANGLYGYASPSWLHRAVWFAVLKVDLKVMPECSGDPRMRARLDEEWTNCVEGLKMMLGWEARRFGVAVSRDRAANISLALVKSWPAFRGHLSNAGQCVGCAGDAGRCGWICELCASRIHMGGVLSDDRDPAVERGWGWME